MGRDGYVRLSDVGILFVYILVGVVCRITYPLSTSYSMKDLLYQKPQENKTVKSHAKSSNHDSFLDISTTLQQKHAVSRDIEAPYYAVFAVVANSTDS